MISSLERILQSVCKVTKKNALIQIAFILIPFPPLRRGLIRPMSLARLTRSMDVQMGSPPELSHTLYLGHSEGTKTNIPRAHLRSYKERLRHLCKVIGANIPRPLWRSLRVHRWGSRNALQRNLNRWLLREGEYPRSASYGTDDARGIWGLHGVAISPTV